MSTTIVIVLAALGFFAWGIAIISAVRIVAAAPKGERLGTYGKIGWWQFAEIRHALGPSVDPHIRAYQRAFITFIACVVLAMIAGTLLGMQAQA